MKAWEPGLAYIAAHPEIRDVVISGGDPLTMSDSHIKYLLMRLRAINHIEIIRIGTKVPVVTNEDNQITCFDVKKISSALYEHTFYSSF